MTAFEQSWAASRRLFILRFLVEAKGAANESVVASTVRQGGFAQTPKDGIRADLDHLRDTGCVTEEWYDALRVVKLTERGEDAAFGRVEIAGIESSIWRRH